MFKNSYQNGLLSIFYSCGSNPLAIWDMEVKNGHIKRLSDNDVNSIVLEIVSTNVATTYITCPKNNQVLGIKLPFLVMIVKNLKRYFSFEIMILDDKNMRRRFRISNFQSTTKIKPFCTSMPIGLAGGWNQIQFNLADFTRRAYGTQFIEALRVQVHANARLRRIYFSERLYTEEELPQDYKLYLPLERKQKKGKFKKEEEAALPAKGAAVTEAAPQVEIKPSTMKKSGVIRTPTSTELKPAKEEDKSEEATSDVAVTEEESPATEQQLAQAEEGEAGEELKKGEGEGTHEVSKEPSVQGAEEAGEAEGAAAPEGTEEPAPEEPAPEEPAPEEPAPEEPPPEEPAGETAGKDEEKGEAEHAGDAEAEEAN